MPTDTRRQIPAATAPTWVTLGEHSYAHPTVISFEGDSSHVYIGKYCSINGEAKFFVGGEHRTDWISTYPFRIRMELDGAFEDGCPATNGDIQVGHDVWIGYDALVLSGVTIGHGAVVGARTVVTKDVPPYAVVVGNPARVVRFRFSAGEREALLRIAWWDWPHERVLAAVGDLNGTTVSEFVARYCDRSSDTQPELGA